MSADLRELYQGVILDHNKRPRNFGEPPCSNRSAQGVNPLCGDQLTVYLSVEDDIVKDVGFEGIGCAISTASASLMTESIKGKRIDEVERLFEGFREMVTADRRAPREPADLGKLAVFSGVREFPMRVKCATLAWHALREALRESTRVATTE
ncbi:MAG TPA: SUF system NifU family Fe-S cluster assembly protein [Myxococcota bacterium]|nr:SUF system NifU family Fe-S cluster assembly protein [Myxococcota bacterium]